MSSRGNVERYQVGGAAYVGNNYFVSLDHVTNGYDIIRVRAQTADGFTVYFPVTQLVSSPGRDLSILRLDEPESQQDIGKRNQILSDSVVAINENCSVQVSDSVYAFGHQDDLPFSYMEGKVAYHLNNTQVLTNLRRNPPTNWDETPPPNWDQSWEQNSFRNFRNSFEPSDNVSLHLRTPLLQLSSFDGQKGTSGCPLFKKEDNSFLGLVAAAKLYAFVIPVVVINAFIRENNINLSPPPPPPPGENEDEENREDDDDDDREDDGDDDDNGDDDDGDAFHEAYREALPCDYVGLNDLKHGFVASYAKDDPAQESPYFRNLFRDKSAPALADVKNKKLMSLDAELCRLIHSMEKGVFNALQKKYLKTLMFRLYETFDGPVIEEYMLSFSYSNTDSQEVLMNIICSGTKKGGTFKYNSSTEITPSQMRSSACKMARTLIQQLRTLDKTPAEPMDYELPFFQGCKEESDNPWSRNPLKMAVGQVNNKHLVLALKAKSVLGPCEYENNDFRDDEVGLGDDSILKEGNSDSYGEMSITVDDNYIVAPIVTRTYLSQEDNGALDEDNTLYPADDEQQLGPVKDWISSYHLDTIRLTDVLPNFTAISV